MVFYETYLIILQHACSLSPTKPAIPRGRNYPRVVPFMYCGVTPQLSGTRIPAKLGDIRPLLETNGKQFEAIWREAIVQYTVESGINLPHPGDVGLSLDGVMSMLDGRLGEFKAFRERKEKLRGVLSPVVDVLQLFSNTADKASSFAPPPVLSSLLIWSLRHHYLHALV